MKTRTAVLLLVAALLLLRATSTLAQATRPPHLSQFPTVERVKAEVKGSDPLDTAARQMGVFWQLMELINVLAGPRFQSMEFTPDEERVKEKYYEAWQWFQYKERAPPPQDEPRWNKLVELYSNDPGFLDELMKRFLTPEIRVGYYRATGKKPPAAGSASPVATARASGVDTKVFGIQMGELLTLAVCSSRGGVLFQNTDTSHTCVVGQEDPLKGNALAGAIIEALVGPHGKEVKEDPDTRYVQIFVEKELCAEWMSFCTITALVHKGVFAAAYITTKGRTVEDDVAEELEGKYGKRHSTTQLFITANSGAKFTVHKREWAMPGFYVEFHPINKEITDGLVIVETEVGHRIRMEKVRQKKKPRL